MLDAKKQQLNGLEESTIAYSWNTPHDALYNTDLTVERALEKIDPAVRHNYKAMYEWFIGNTENGAEFGTREYGRGQRLPGVDADFAHAAQRGIHVPTKQRYAATITIKKDSLYGKSNLDGQRIKLGDGTWLLSYAAHRNNTDGETFAHWNDGLMNCCYDGVPVGVFMESKKGYYRALAFVEDYNAETDTFLLHGPVTSSNSNAFRAPVKADAELAGITPNIDELNDDCKKREIQIVCRREGQKAFRNKLLEAYEGRCAISGGNARETLQGAHIIQYRGKQSNIVSNGLLLRADIHILYDRLLLSVEPESHRVDLHPCLEQTEYEPLHGRIIDVPKQIALRPDDRLLAINYEKFRNVAIAG